MIGLDTNALVRYIMQDDKKQADQASAIIDLLTLNNPGFIPCVVLVELSWVLERAYKLKREQISAVLEGLLSAYGLMIENPEICRSALSIYQAGSANFADCFIERAAFFAGCRYTVTFDQKAAKSCGMTLIT